MGAGHLDGPNPKYRHLLVPPIPRAALPHIRRRPILGDAGAVPIHGSEMVLGLGRPLVGGLAVPFQRPVVTTGRTNRPESLIGTGPLKSGWSMSSTQRCLDLRPSVIKAAVELV